MGTSASIRIRYIRASCVWIEWDGAYILTDPWFAPRMRGLPVFVKPCVRPGALPPLDLVLASHFHPDHFDRRAMRELRHEVARLVVPPPPPGALDGVRTARIAVLGDGSVFEDAEFTIRAIRVLHSGFELGYLIERRGQSVFFGGDARYTEVFARIGAAHRVDIALLPCGGTEIAGRRIVMNPLDCVQAAIDLRCRSLVPIHEGGEWMSVPPFSRHPGRAAHVADFAARAGAPFRTVVIRPGEAREFGAGGLPVEGA